MLVAGGRRSAAWVLAIGAVGLGAACQAKEVDRAPPFAGEGGSAPRPPLVIDGHAGSAGESGSGGSEGTGGAAQTGKVVGRVVSILSEDFFFAEPFDQTAQVWAEPMSGSTWQRTPYDGTSFTFDDVALTSSTWLGAVPDDTSPYHPSFANLVTKDGRADVPLVPRDVLDSVFLTLNLPEEPSPTAGHVVVRVVTPQGEGWQGVTVTVPAASLVTYAGGGTFSEFEEATSKEGLAVAGNVPARSFPGDFISVVLSGAVKRTVPVPVAADTVTLLQVTVKAKTP